MFEFVAGHIEKISAALWTGNHAYGIGRDESVDIVLDIPCGPQSGRVNDPQLEGSTGPGRSAITMGTRVGHEPLIDNSHATTDSLHICQRDGGPIGLYCTGRADMRTSKAKTAE